MAAWVLDSRPPTSHADDASAPPAAMTPFDPLPFAHAHTHTQHQPQPQPQPHPHTRTHTHTHTIPHPHNVLDLAVSYHVSTVHVPAPHPAPSVGPMSSAEHALEPPPTLHDAHLSILDRASFAPITSFFHYLTPDKPVVPGLDLVCLPDVIDRHHLAGDHYDFQGIDWAARNTTRAAVRAKRRDFEHERLPPALKELRAVCCPSLISLSLSNSD